MSTIFKSKFPHKVAFAYLVLIFCIVENAVTNGVIQELMQKIDSLNKTLNQKTTDLSETQNQLKQLNETLNQKTTDLK